MVTRCASEKPFGRSCVSSNPFSYRLYLFFHFLDHFCSYQDPILKSIPTQRRLTGSPIKKLKRCHLNGALIVVVECKLYQWQELFPMFLLVHHVHTQHIFKDLVHHFCLPICLRVIRGIKVKLGFQGLLENNPKSSCKHQSSIGYDPFRHAMQSHNLADKNYSYVWRLIRCTHWDKMCTLRQSVNYHEK
jgi:hypothetical protein